MPPPRNDASKTPGIVVAFWLGGSLVLLLFAGLVGAIFYFLIFGSVLLWRWNRLVGVLTTVTVLALFVGPAIFDGAAFERQVEQVRAHQVTDPPVDLTGSNVLFLGMSGRYHPEDCTDLCRNIAAFGGADGVYFGFNRSADVRLMSSPINLLARELRQFDGPLLVWPEEGTPVERAEPDRIDYVVYQGGHVDADMRPELFPQVSDFGFYPMVYLFLEYAIYPVDDATAFDPSTTTPIFTRFEFARPSATVPDIPRLLSGDTSYRHRYAPGQSQWNTLNTREAAAFLCGAQTRADYTNCTFVP